MEEFRQIIMTEFPKLHVFCSSRGAHSFLQDSVFKSKTVRKKEIDPDGNMFEYQNLCTGVARKE